MARLNPETYPDRLAFEAHARKLRSAEIARLWRDAAAWFARHCNEVSGAVTHLVAGSGTHSHR